MKKYWHIEFNDGKRFKAYFSPRNTKRSSVLSILYFEIIENVYNFEVEHFIGIDDSEIDNMILDAKNWLNKKFMIDPNWIETDGDKAFEMPKGWI